jgi:hypothetical protein
MLNVSFTLTKTRVISFQSWCVCFSSWQHWLNIVDNQLCICHPAIAWGTNRDIRPCRRSSGWPPASHHGGPCPSLGGESGVGFVVHDVALGQVFLEYFGFPYHAFHRLLHTNHHSSSWAGKIGHLVVSIPLDLRNNKNRTIKVPCINDSVNMGDLATCSYRLTKGSAPCSQAWK